MVVHQRKSLTIFWSMIAALLVFVHGATAQQPATVKPATTQPATVQQANGVEIHRSSRTGMATFLRGAVGQTIPVAGVAGRAKQPTPIQFLQEYGRVFGIRDVATQLRESRTHTDWIGRTRTEYQQVHKSVPVFSGVLKVHQDATGAFVAVNGYFHRVSEKLNVTPTLTSAEAVALAGSQVVSVRPVVEKAELVVVDPGWYGDPPLGAHLAYHIILRDAGLNIRGAFFVDAHEGSVLDQWSMIHTGLFRSVFDASGINSLNALPGDLARSEGDGPTGVAEEDRAYNYAADFFRYYANAFGRDSIDDAGLSIIASVNTNWNGCPNAFWDGFQAVFCPTIATDDVVAHEYTHGVTEHTAGLIYQNQSGQLNESFSDVFGEIVDLLNGDVGQPGGPGGIPWPINESGPGTDLPNNRRSSNPDACSVDPDYTDGVRWLVSEDGAEFGGAIRDMWNPACFDDPPSANSPLMQCQVSDSGGVHSGSGVPNHAFAIITDGKTFNGVIVEGIGLIKSGAVWYRALTTYLTPSSDFEDAFEAFRQSAIDLIGTFPNDPRTGLASSEMFTVSDVENVVKGLRAVEMNTPGRCGRYRPFLDPTSPELCKPPVLIFEDGFEEGAGAWQVSHSGPFGPPTPYDWVLTDELPYGKKGTAWFCADPFFGDCDEVDESSVHNLLSPEISLPKVLRFPILSFEHSFGTEPEYDGGNVKISINGGAFVVIPIPAYPHNPLNGRLRPQSFINRNPIGGEPGFTGGSGGWGTSLVDLSDLVSGGETIRLRFDFGKDGCTGDVGWYIDNVRIIDCFDSSDCNGNRLPDEFDVSQGPRSGDILSNVHLLSGGVISDADNDGFGIRSRAVPFNLFETKVIHQVTIWGGYLPFGGAPPAVIPEDRFHLLIHDNNGGVPGTVLFADNTARFVRTPTGERHFNVDVFEFTYSFDYPRVILAGNYFIQIFNDTPDSPDTFYWETSEYTGTFGFLTSGLAPGVNWSPGGAFNLAIRIPGEIVGSDCDDDGVPDECETDCNGNRIPDPCDIRDGVSLDVNGNGLPDECQCDERQFGDIAPAGGDGVVDMLDVLCVIDGAMNLTMCSEADLSPCGGNGVVDLSDLLVILNAFAGAEGCCGK